MPDARRYTESDRTARPENSAADLLRVAGRLGADPYALRAAAVLLGLAEPRPPAPSPDPRHRPPAHPALPDPPAARDPLARTEVEDTVAEVRPTGGDQRTPRAARLSLVESPAATPPRPVTRRVHDLFPPPATPSASAAGEPVPLFEPAHQRAVLSTLVSVDRAGADLDFDALVDRIATRQPIGNPPRLPRPTTRLGVQLLLDRRPAMDPFRRDQRILTAALRLVVGADLVEVLAVRGNLDDAVPAAGPRRKPVPYHPGRGPRPILLASDLGIARQPTDASAARPADWLRLADRAIEAGTPLVVLNPYPPARWPEWATRALAVVHWDRSADAGQARRMARHAAALARIRP